MKSAACCPVGRRYIYAAVFYFGSVGHPHLTCSITILNMFNQNLYPIMGPQGISGDSQPVQSYTGKEVSLKRFLNQGKETREEILKKMQPIIGDIFRLWDTIEREFPEMVQKSKHYYGSKKYSKYNRGEVVGQTMFQQSDIKYLVPKGILYPVVGAFRALVKVDPETGFYGWKKILSLLGTILASKLQQPFGMKQKTILSIWEKVEIFGAIFSRKSCFIHWCNRPIFCSAINNRPPLLTGRGLILLYALAKWTPCSAGESKNFRCKHERSEKESITLRLSESWP